MRTDFAPSLDRLKRYRQLAREALHRANLTRDKAVQADFITMAAGWQQMADEIEREIERQANPSVLQPSRGTAAGRR